MTVISNITSLLIVQWTHDGNADKYVVTVNATEYSFENNIYSTSMNVTSGARYCVTVEAIKGVLSKSADGRCVVAGEHSFALISAKHSGSRCVMYI